MGLPYVGPPPTNPTDVSTKGYVDGVKASLEAQLADALARIAVLEQGGGGSTTLGYGEGGYGEGGYGTGV